MRGQPAPAEFADSSYGEREMRSTSPRVTRAKMGESVIPNIRMTFIRLRPMIAAMNTTKSK